MKATKPQCLPLNFSSSVLGYMIFTLARGPNLGGDVKIRWKNFYANLPNISVRTGSVSLGERFPR